MAGLATGAVVADGRPVVDAVACRQPRGVLEAVRRESLTAAEVREVVDLLLSSSTREQKQLVLEKPRQALSQARGGPTRSWDPRLSTAGSRVARKLVSLSRVQCVRRRPSPCGRAFRPAFRRTPPPHCPDDGPTPVRSIEPRLADSWNSELVRSSQPTAYERNIASTVFMGR